MTRDKMNHLCLKNYDLTMKERLLIYRKMKPAIEYCVTEDNPCPFIGFTIETTTIPDIVHLGVKTNEVTYWILWDVPPYSFLKEMGYIQDKYGKYFRGLNDKKLKT